MTWGTLNPFGAEIPAPVSDGAVPVRTWPSVLSSPSGALRRAIVGVDDYLSERAGVRPYHRDDSCLFRLAVAPAVTTVRLGDGCIVRPGDPVGELHLWNEHIPSVSSDGPDLAWARHVSLGIKSSLTLLAQALASDPAWRDIKACRACTNFVGLNGSGQSLTRLIGRFGFEEVDERHRGLPSRLHDALENVLVGALVWTHNPQAFRRDKLIRQRRAVWISRERLIARHGRSGES